MKDTLVPMDTFNSFVHPPKAAEFDMDGTDELMVTWIREVQPWNIALLTAALPAIVAEVMAVQP